MFRLTAWKHQRVYNTTEHVLVNWLPFFYRNVLFKEQRVLRCSKVTFVARVLTFMIHKLAAGIVIFCLSTERHRWVLILFGCTASFLWF